MVREARSTTSERQLTERPKRFSHMPSSPRASEPPSRSARPWGEICVDCKNHWVALESASYDEQGRAKSGVVVDSDRDLAALCARMRASDKRNCAIVFCTETGDPAPQGDEDADPFAGSAH